MAENTLSIREKIGYGMGDAGCNIIFGAIMLFVNYFYTDIFGLAPALVGVLLLSVRVIDAVTDPIMGALADRTRSKYGRFRPWLLWIAFPYALFSVLMFTTPEWTYNSKVIYAFVTYFLLSITYTAINIPYCSLGTVMTADPKERVACQSYRFVMVGIATLLLSLTLLPMADWFGGADKAKGYQMAMTVLAFIGMCMFLFCFATVRERIRPAVQTNDELKKDLKDVWKNDQWVRILLLTLFYRYMRPLIEHGYVYAAVPPLHRIALAGSHKGEFIYTYSDDELAGRLADLERRHISYNPDIQRYKGLGEMDADQLADTTMDPRTRMLRRIRMEDAAQASEIFSLLMGDDVPPRKAFIVDNADDFDRSKIDT